MKSSWKSLWIPFVTTIASCLLLSYLGIWQLNKYFHKKEINKQNTNSTYQLVEPYNSKMHKDEVLYKNFHLQGQFIDKEIFAYKRFENNTSSKKMFEYCMVVAPLKLNDGQIVMVARGLLEESKCNKADVDKLNLSFAANLKAMALPSEEKSLWTNFVDKKNNMWFFIDLKDIAQFINESIQTDYYFLVEEDYDDATNKLDIIPSIKTAKYQHHLWYAINWFTMLIILLILCIFYYKSVKLK